MQGCAGVVHLAAVDDEPDERDPLTPATTGNLEQVMATNVGGTSQVLTAAAEAGVRASCSCPVSTCSAASWARAGPSTCRSMTSTRLARGGRTRGPSWPARNSAGPSPGAKAHRRHALQVHPLGSSRAHLPGWRPIRGRAVEQRSEAVVIRPLRDGQRERARNRRTSVHRPSRSAEPGSTGGRMCCSSWPGGSKLSWCAAITSSVTSPRRPRARFSCSR